MSMRLDLLDQLHQDETWTDKAGVTWRLDEMSYAHLVSLQCWLEARSVEIQDADLWRFVGGPMPTGEAAQDCLESATDEAMSRSPQEYLAELPLYARIRGLVDTRRVPVASEARRRARSRWWWLRNRRRP